jgi:hypothetical protein
LLNKNEHQVLTQLVFFRLGANTDVQTISIWVGRNDVSRLPVTTTVWQIAEWIVDTVLRQAKPDGLVRVIRLADNHQAGFESLLKLAERLENEPGFWKPVGSAEVVSWALDEDPLIVDDGGPFLDRLDFRRLLPRVDGELTTPTCLLVHGDEGTGKTYLQKFCQGFAAQRKDFALGFSKLGSTGLKDIPPRTVAQELAHGLGTDVNKLPKLPNPDPHRDALLLAAWITSYTPRRKVPALAILDDFGLPDLNEAVHTFVLELVRLVQHDEQVAQKIRVVLLGYPAERLSQKGLQYVTHVLEYVDDSHIDKWFRQRFPNHPEYRYEDVITVLNQEQIPPGNRRMRDLCNFVKMVSSQFEMGRP